MAKKNTNLKKTFVDKQDTNKEDFSHDKSLDQDPVVPGDVTGGQLHAGPHSSALAAKAI